MLQVVQKPLAEPGSSAERSWRQRNIEAIAAGFAWVELLTQGADDVVCEAAANRYRDIRRQMREAHEPATIDRVAAAFRLAPVDEDVLLIALSSQRLATPKAVTPAALQAFLAAAGPEAAALLWDRLAAYAPLRNFRLIEAGSGPFSALTPIALDERIGRLLLGDASPDERLRNLLVPVEGGTCLARHAPTIERLTTNLRLRQRPMAVIIGPADSGRRAAAQALARQFGLSVVELKPRLQDNAGDLLPVLAREAILEGYALLIDAAMLEARRLVEDHFAAFDGLVIVIGESRPEFALDVPVLELERPEIADRIELWRGALSGTEAEEQVPALASQFKLGPRGIAAAIKSGSDLRHACRAEARRALQPLAERIVPRYGWEDIVLPTDILNDLQAAAAQVKHHATVYYRYGFAEHQARGQGVSVLLSGPSGTGKTMAAEVIARELELDLFRIDLSRVVSKYIGETEKNLRAVFDAAECGGAILFFDEADALFGKRSEVKDSHDRFANIEVSYLLQRMESYEGLAILATNMKSHIDTAFLRRLRFVLDVPFPDAAARRQIWAKAFPAAMPTTGIDLDALARLEIAGGNISVIAINAAFLAAAAGLPLTMAQIARAARAEYRKLDRELRVAWGDG